MSDSRPYCDFAQASRSVLTHLRSRFDFDLWLVTRIEGDDWIVLQCDSLREPIGNGAVLRWSDSERRILIEDRPCLPADTPATEAAAPLSRQFEVGSYVGVPVMRPDGSMFGRLCALDGAEGRTLADPDLELLELLARMLATLLERELVAIERERSIERLEHESTVDSLTGLRNRRGWERKLREEEARTRRLGSPACVWVLDLDNLKEINDTYGHRAGDRLLQRAADSIASALRESDVAARVGGDEFTVLALDCGSTGAEELHQRLCQALESSGIRASIGRSMRDPGDGLAQAWEAADRSMYRAKSGAHAAAGRHGPFDQ